MPPIFFSKISIEARDSRSDVAEAEHEEILPTMVEQRNHFSNKFDDFQLSIEELKDQSLMATQCLEQLEAQMVEQAKVMVMQAKVMVMQAKVMAKQAKVKVD